MSFDNISSSIKLNNIKTYDTSKTNTNNVFKKQIYSDIEEVDYGSYEEIDYNGINLEEGKRIVEEEQQSAKESAMAANQEINNLILTAKADKEKANEIEKMLIENKNPSSINEIFSKDKYERERLEQDATSEKNDLDLSAQVTMNEAIKIYDGLSDLEKSYLDQSTILAIETYKSQKQASIEINEKRNELNALYQRRFDKKDYKANKEMIEARIVELERELELPHYELEKTWYEKALATAVVGYTSVGSGVLKLYEYTDDGLTWIGGMAVSGTSRLFGADEFAENVEEWTMDEIARDRVGELNEFFYENTELGKTINDASYLKYDSKVAKGIQNVTTEVVIIAGATAATVVTGGAAAPLFAAGFVVGAGQSAEKNYQDTENRDFWKDSVEIAVDGTIKGLSTMAYGKAGAAAVNGVKSLGNLGLSGIKEVGKQTISSISKESLKQTAKQTGKNFLKTAGQTLIDKDTWLETGSVLLDDVKTGMQTGEWDVLKMVGDATLIYGENYIGNLAGNVIGDVISSPKSSVYLDASKPSSVQQLPTQVNSVIDYEFDRSSTIDYIIALKNKEYTDNQIIEMLADYGSSCSDYNNKRAFADISYEFLLSTGYSPEDAADMLIDVYNNQLTSRGMKQVFVDNNGIKYNYLNNFNLDNQAYSIPYVMEQINGLPEDVRKTITEVNFYDTFNPADYYWQARYKSDGANLFQSAATAGDGQINIWSNSFVSDGVIAHEAGHCFDVNGQYSGSQEYLEAIWRDSQLTGKQSITDYGGNNPAEDFAETMAAYKNGYVVDVNGEYSLIDQFPNRKMFIEKNMKVDGQQYLSIFDMNQLNEVAGSLVKDYGQEQALWSFYHYLSTGDVNNIPLPSLARELVSNIDINEVVEFYNLWNGAFSK